MSRVGSTARRRRARPPPKRATHTAAKGVARSRARTPKRREACDVAKAPPRTFVYHLCASLCRSLGSSETRERRRRRFLLPDTRASRASPSRPATRRRPRARRPPRTTPRAARERARSGSLPRAYLTTRFRHPESPRAKNRACPRTRGRWSEAGPRVARAPLSRTARGRAPRGDATPRRATPDYSPPRRDRTDQTRRFARERETRRGTTPTPSKTRIRSLSIRLEIRRSRRDSRTTPCGRRDVTPCLSHRRRARRRSSTRAPRNALRRLRPKRR
mmetsp:Transcript_12247/g.51253  ORF Transcript_12247/g.51253 Transcript_12247/m.51253 type:complete len:274 (-) Transcript_12247:959-1780(-)